MTYDGHTLTYDADGNLLRKVRTAAPGASELRLRWNSLGQLDSAWTQSSGGWVTYAYDGWGRRVKKTSATGVATWYLHDGDQLAAELNAFGDPVNVYSYYPGVDAPHAMRRGSIGSMYYYARDAEGNAKNNQTDTLSKTDKVRALGRLLQ